MIKISLYFKLVDGTVIELFQETNQIVLTFPSEKRTSDTYEQMKSAYQVAGVIKQ